MMRPGPEVTVYLCVAPVDMRKQAASLALLVEQSLGRNVFDPALYVFSNRKRDRVRIVYWERNGVCKPSTQDPWCRFRVETTVLPMAPMVRS